LFRYIIKEEDYEEEVDDDVLNLPSQPEGSVRQDPDDLSLY
jgi:hypothetical protein